MGLDMVRERCTGIDVHKRQITVHVHVPGHQEMREFATDTGALFTEADLDLICWTADRFSALKS